MSETRQILQKDIDYYLDEQGFWVFTKSYLESRGYCCRSGCRHCPYGFKFSSSLLKKTASMELEEDTDAF